MAGIKFQFRHDKAERVEVGKLKAGDSFRICSNWMERGFYMVTDAPSENGFIICVRHDGIIRNFKANEIVLEADATIKFKNKEPHNEGY